MLLLDPLASTQGRGQTSPRWLSLTQDPLKSSPQLADIVIAACATTRGNPILVYASPTDLSVRIQARQLLSQGVTLSSFANRYSPHLYAITLATREYLYIPPPTKQHPSPPPTQFKTLQVTQRLASALDFTSLFPHQPRATLYAHS